MNKVKGRKNGLCNRSACQSPTNVVWYNTGSYAYYCEECAKLINDRNNMKLCVKEDPDSPERYVMKEKYGTKN